jgi:hypothetical protein
MTPYDRFTTPSRIFVAGVAFPICVTVATRGGCTVKLVVFVTLPPGVVAFPVSDNCTVNGNAVAVVTLWVMPGLLAARVSEGACTGAEQDVLKLLEPVAKP